MASIRKRLSQIWRRSSEKETPREDEPSSADRRDSTASLDSGYSSGTSHKAADSAQPATPRNLHKAASMTFQSFSDTIRSKTRLFYASPENPDTASCDHTETTPKSHQPRTSRIISSVMSHEGHVSLDNRLQSGRSSPTPMPRAAKPQWITPTIDVKIPDSFLTDSEILEDNNQKSSVEMAYQAPTLATLKPYGPWQIWPTPIDVALQQFSKIDIKSTGIPRSPMIDDPAINSSEDFMYDSAMFDHHSRVLPSASEYQDPKMKDSYSNGKFHFKVLVPELKSPALRSDIPSHPLSHADAATKGQEPGNASVLKADEVNYQGSRVRWSLPEELYKEGNGTGIVLKRPDPSSQPNQAEMPLSYSDTAPGQIFHRTISHKTGLRDLYAASNSFLKHDEQEHGTRQWSPSVSESDEEPEAPSAEVPAMGSRREWDKIRADRYNRYFAIQQDHDAMMKEYSELRLELDNNPARRLLEEMPFENIKWDTTHLDQGFDSSFAIDEVADSPKKSPESNPKSNHYGFEITNRSLFEQSLGFSEEYPPSDLTDSDLSREFDASVRSSSQEWWSSLEWSPSSEKWQPRSEWSLPFDYASHPNPSSAAHPVDAEAALYRLAGKRLGQSDGSWYDCENELYIQYERSDDMTTFPALVAPFEDYQDRKNTGTEELESGSASGVQQFETIDGSFTGSIEETDPFGYFSLGSGVVWSRLFRMDAPGGTKILEGHALDVIDECSEGNEGILSENECSPLDENPVYLNPSPFPDLRKYGDDDYTLSSMFTDNNLMDQTFRLALLEKHEACSLPIKPNFCDHTNTDFWADLQLDLKDSFAERQNTEKESQSDVEHDTKKSSDFYDNIMQELDEMRDITHELDDPDRTFNAARLPKFNSIPSSALQNLVEIRGTEHVVASLGSPGVEKENKISSPGSSGHGRWARKRPTMNLARLSPYQPRYRGDQTSPGKKELHWASDVEYIEAPSPTLSEKSNESRRKEKTYRSKLTLSIPQEQVLKQLPYRLFKSSDVEAEDVYW